jgi:hypothetical protein
VRFKVLTAVKMAIFWVVTPCGLVEVDEFSEVLNASVIIVVIMEAVITSEKSVNF